MRHGIIYAAEFPNGKRYIGQTVMTLKRRQAAHFAQRKHTPISHAFAKYGAAAKWRILAVVGEDFLDDCERFYIAEFRARGIPLYNCTDGGKRGKMTDKTRAKIGAASKGRKMSAESRAKLSASRKGIVFTPEHRANISASWHDSKPRFTPECRAKISAANKRRWAREKEARK